MAEPGALVSLARPPRASPRCADPSCRLVSAPPANVQELSPAQQQQDEGLCQPARALRAAGGTRRGPGAPGCVSSARDHRAAAAPRRRQIRASGGNLKINNCNCRSLELAGLTKWENPFFLCNVGGATGNPKFTSHSSYCSGMEQLLLGEAQLPKGCLCS